MEGEIYPPGCLFRVVKGRIIPTRVPLPGVIKEDYTPPGCLFRVYDRVYPPGCFFRVYTLRGDIYQVNLPPSHPSGRHIPGLILLLTPFREAYTRVYLRVYTSLPGIYQGVPQGVY